MNRMPLPPDTEGDESELISSYRRLPSLPVPSHLDAAILARARSVARIHRLRWIPSLAAAAGVVAAVILIMAGLIAPPTPSPDSQNAGLRLNVRPATEAELAELPAGAALPAQATLRQSSDGERGAVASVDLSGLDADAAPELWFAHIRALHADGASSEARAALRDLRSAHPELPLPPDIEALLHP